MIASSVLPMMASSDDSTMEASRARISRSRCCSVTSCTIVRQWIVPNGSVSGTAQTRARKEPSRANVLRLEPGDREALRDLRDVLAILFASLGGDRGQRPTDDLVGRPAVRSLGGRVPHQHGAVEVGHDHRQRAGGDEVRLTAPWAAARRRLRLRCPRSPPSASQTARHHRRRLTRRCVAAPQLAATRPARPCKKACRFYPLGGAGQGDSLNVQQAGVPLWACRHRSYYRRDAQH